MPGRNQKLRDVFGKPAAPVTEVSTAAGGDWYEAKPTSIVDAYVASDSRIPISLMEKPADSPKALSGCGCGMGMETAIDTTPPDLSPPFFTFDTLKMGIGSLLAGGAGAGIAHFLGKSPVVGGAAGASLTAGAMAAYNFWFMGSPFISSGTTVYDGTGQIPADSVPMASCGMGTDGAVAVGSFTGLMTIAGGTALLYWLTRPKEIRRRNPLDPFRSQEDRELDYWQDDDGIHEPHGWEHLEDQPLSSFAAGPRRYDLLERAYSYDFARHMQRLTGKQRPTEEEMYFVLRHEGIDRNTAEKASRRAASTLYRQHGTPGSLELYR